MSDTITDEQRRNVALHSAYADGFSTFDMMAPNTSIAAIAARLYARASINPDFDNAGALKDHVVPLMAYDGAMPSEEVTIAIADLHKVHDAINATYLGRIGRLLSLHASYTRSHPANCSFTDWYNEITNIGVNIWVANDLLTNESNAEHGRELMQYTMKRLSIALPSLWS